MLKSSRLSLIFCGTIVWPYLAQWRTHVTETAEKGGEITQSGAGEKRHCIVYPAYHCICILHISRRNLCLPGATTLLGPCNSYSLKRNPSTLTTKAGCVLTTSETTRFHKRGHLCPWRP